MCIVRVGTTQQWQLVILCALCHMLLSFSKFRPQLFTCFQSLVVHRTLFYVSDETEQNNASLFGRSSRDIREIRGSSILPTEPTHNTQRTTHRFHKPPKHQNSCDSIPRTQQLINPETGYFPIKYDGHSLRHARCSGNRPG